MKWILAAFSVALLVACDVSPAAVAPPPPATPESAMGANDVYVRECSACHGAEGRGDGPAAEFLFPKPRNFTKAYYRLRTTDGLPTDDDLLRTITNGIPGAAMPSFAFLPEADRRALVAHIKTFAKRYDDEEEVWVNLFESRGVGNVLRVPEAPKETPDLAALGKATYEKMQCFKCHGESGYGDGPSAPTLVDNEDFPIRPADFTRGIFKGGDTVTDIYTRFSVGMGGTPMPSFAGELSDRERWALAYYVKSLVREDAKPLRQASRTPFKGGAVSHVPLEADAPEWRDAPATEFPMMALWQRSSAPRHVVARVIHSATHVGVMMEWVDDAVDGATLRPQDFSDAAAVMFSLTDPPGHFSMGNADRPCNIWQWRFSRQMDLARFIDMETQYPGMVADDYFLARGYYPKDNVWPDHGPVAPAPSHDPGYLAGVAAGNTLSDPTPRSCVEDLLAIGFGTVKPQPLEQQDVEGRGIWDAGRWKVVFRRPLKSLGDDAQFPTGKPLNIAFAVWDGGSGDRNGIKSVTFWHTVTLEP